MSSAQDPFYIVVRDEIQDSRLEIRALDDLLSLPPSDDGATEAEWHYGKRQRFGGGNRQVPNEFVMPPPQPPPVPTQVPEPLAFVRGADTNKGGGGRACQAVPVHNKAARQRRIRKRISEKTAELARHIPGARKLSTAEMLEEAARHVKLLQAQVGMLALMRAAGGSSEFMAQERLHALLASGSVQERLAAEGKCLVPWNLVYAVARDAAVRANAVVRRDLGRFVASLLPAGQ